MAKRNQERQKITCAFLMHLLDSNIVIYSSKPSISFLRDFIINNDCYIASISVIEVLGYKKLEVADKRYFEAAFQLVNIIPLSEVVIHEAISLRQMRSISLADSIIAATAITSNCRLVTRNIDDFRGIKKLKLFNPFKE